MSEGGNVANYYKPIKYYYIQSAITVRWCLLVISVICCENGEITRTANTTLNLSPILRCTMPHNRTNLVYICSKGSDELSNECKREYSNPFLYRSFPFCNIWVGCASLIMVNSAESCIGVLNSDFNWSHCVRFRTNTIENDRNQSLLLAAMG